MFNVRNTTHFTNFLSIFKRLYCLLYVFQPIMHKMYIQPSRATYYSVLKNAKNNPICLQFTGHGPFGPSPFVRFPYFAASRLHPFPYKGEHIRVTVTRFYHPAIIIIPLSIRVFRINAFFIN